VTLYSILVIFYNQYTHTIQINHQPDATIFRFILYIFPTNISTEYFKHAAHSPFFSSKCRLFHNAIFSGFCIIHILHTGVLKFECKI
jgi:hypothetical protein